MSPGPENDPGGDTRPHPGRDHHDVTRPVPDPGRVLWPTWDICRWCRRQLYTDPAITLGMPGHLVPRLDPHQRHCPAADRPGQGHKADDADSRRRLRHPECAAMIAIDGPERPRVHCPYRAVRRVMWCAGEPSAPRSERGCHLHVADLLDRADREVGSGRALQRTGVTPAFLTDIVYARTTRETAHGKPGRWVEVEHDGPTQHQLF